MFTKGFFADNLVRTSVNSVVKKTCLLNPTTWFSFGTVREANTDSKKLKESGKIDITPRCSKQIEYLKHEDKNNSLYLRVSVESGGCSGFQYMFSLEDKCVDEALDKIFLKGKSAVVCDRMTYMYLQGSTIDFEESLIRSSFIVTENPNASNGCGCGVSFSPNSNVE
jgi:iron-sulfur cluster assembly accessory protein